MTHILKYLVVAFLVIQFPVKLVHAQGSTGTQSIAVLNNQSPGRNVPDNFASQVVDSVINVLRKFKRFNVVERSQMNQLINELKFQNSGLVESQAAVAFGKQTGAELVALVNYTNTVERDRDLYTMSLNVNVRFVDVKSGSIFLSKQIRASSGYEKRSALIAGALTDLERKLEREFISEFPNSGYVIKILSPNDYVIDLGKSTGVSVNDEFAVFTEGEDIVHPVTMKVIKGEKNMIAEGVIVSVSSETSVLRINTTPGTPALQVGSKVESKPKKKGFMESLRDFSVTR